MYSKQCSYRKLQKAVLVCKMPFIVESHNLGLSRKICAMGRGRAAGTWHLGIFVRNWSRVKRSVARSACGRCALLAFVAHATGELRGMATGASMLRSAIRQQHENCISGSIHATSMANWQIARET